MLTFDPTSLARTPCEAVTSRFRPWHLEFIDALFDERGGRHNGQVSSVLVDDAQAQRGIEVTVGSGLSKSSPRAALALPWRSGGALPRGRTFLAMDWVWEVPFYASRARRLE